MTTKTKPTLLKPGKYEQKMFPFHDDKSLEFKAKECQRDFQAQLISVHVVVSLWRLELFPLAPFQNLKGLRAPNWQLKRSIMQYLRFGKDCSRVGARISPRLSSQSGRRPRSLACHRIPLDSSLSQVERSRESLLLLLLLPRAASANTKKLER